MKELASIIRIKIIFYLSAAMLVALSIISYVRVNTLIKKAELVNHTSEVRLALENVLGTLTYMESNQRGYIITKDSSFLRPYFVNFGTLKSQLNNLDSLVKDNPAQQADAKTLSTLILKRANYLDATLTEAINSDVYEQNLLTGKKLMADVRTRINIMESRENNLLNERTESLSKEFIVTPLYTVFLMLGAVIILIAAYFKIVKELKSSDKLQTEIAESELRIKTILDYAPEAIITIDENGIIQSWNPQAEEMFLWEEEEVTGKTLVETIIPERFREQHTKGMTHFLKTGEGPVINKPLEIFALRKNNIEFPVELKISSSKVNNRYVFIGFVQDITEKKKIEDELKLSNERFFKIFDSNPIALTFGEVGSDKVVYANNLFYSTFGYSQEEVLGHTTEELKIVSDEENARLIPLILNLLDEKRSVEELQALPVEETVELLDKLKQKMFKNGFEVLYTKKNGETFPALVFYEVINVGNKPYTLTSYQDISEIKRTAAQLEKQNEALAKSEERFFKIFNNNPVAMTLSEIKTNKISFANNLFYSMFGYTRKEVIGHTNQELNLSSPEETKRLGAIVLEALQETRTLEELRALPDEEKEELLTKLAQSPVMKNLEVNYIRKNGETFPAILNYEIIAIDNERFTITSYQDVTERKKITTQIEKQNEALIKMNKELESFNYISSHDLQEPLRKIQVIAARIVETEQPNLSETGKDYFKRMQQSAARMQTLINDLLAYSRTNTSENHFQMTDLNVLLEEVKNELKETIQEKHAIIESTEMCVVNVIPFQFHQIMINLISNALKFSKPETPPHIIIKSVVKKGKKLQNENLLPEQNYCHISISDNGIGFEPQYSKKIFEVFQRLHRKEKYSGTGIGLAIVKKIIENHNGIITATSQLNEGATFDIYIPQN